MGDADDVTRVANPLVAARGGSASITATGTGLSSVLSSSPVTVISNPLLKAQRHFLLVLGNKQHKIRSSARTKMALMSEIRRQLNLVADFSVLLWDEDVDDYVEFERWSDLPIGKAKLKVVELESFHPTLLSKDDIDKETANELVFWHESKSDKRVRMHLHPINFGKMRQRASHQWCPVVSFLGPTGGGKSSLICKFKPRTKPIVALDAQPIPTTSNINSFVVAGDQVAPSVQTGVLPATPRFKRRRELAQMANRSPFPYMRLMDIEGEDGGLPLMEYCKSEGGGLEDIELSSTDIVEFVRQLFEKTDKDDLNAYMETRKMVTKQYFPRLSYLTSDVVVYVNTVPPKRESQYLDRIREFASYSQTGVASAERPSLIMVYNQCRRNDAPFDIDESTEHFFMLVDREQELLESFRTVDFVKIPDWEYETLYKNQMESFRERLLQRIFEQRAARHMAGTLFSDVVWFSVLDKVLEHFDEEAISMSKIFARFIISESSLVNRAYHFFDHIYARHNSKQIFLQCREVTLRILGAYAAMKHHGDESVLHNEDTYTKLLDQLLERISRRTPCEKTHKGQPCCEELSLHDAHRFIRDKSGSINDKSSSAELIEVRGSHSFNDPESLEDLLEVLVSTATTFPSPLRKSNFYAALRTVFADGIRIGAGFGQQTLSRAESAGDSVASESSKSDGQPSFETLVATNPASILGKMKLPGDKCFVCMNNKHDVMLSCRHEFCSECVGGFLEAERAKTRDNAVHVSPKKAHKRQRKEIETFPCPLCGLSTAAVPGATPIIGIGGIRVLSLDGGGFRTALHVAVLQRICEITELEIRDLFDYIIGTGMSGPLALALAERHDMDDMHIFFSSLPSVLQRRAVAQRVMGRRLFEFIFGSKFSSTAFERELKTFFGGEKHGLLQQVMRSHEPKVSVVVADVSGLVEMRLFGNYPPGRRNLPKLDCDLPIWEAARASAAIPDLFDPYTTGGDEVFVDGSLFGLNPALIALSEAQRVWRYEEDLDFVLSLGTGLQSSKNPKSENNMRFMNENLDLGALAARVESELDIVLSEDRYCRLNPDIPLSGRDNTSDPRILKSVMRHTESWMSKNRDTLVETALRLKGKCFTIDGPTSVEVGTTLNFAIRSRLRPTVSMADPEFHVVLNDGPLGSASQKPVNVKIKKGSKAHGAEDSRHTDKWSVAVRPRKVGQFQLHVFASFPDRLEMPSFQVHIGGSPMVLNVEANNVDVVTTNTSISSVEEESNGAPSRPIFVPRGLPTKRFIPFSEFIRLMPISNGGPVQEAEEEEDVLGQHKDVVRERVDRYGLLSPTLLQSPRRAPDCMFRSCSDFLFGSPERHDFVRRSAAGWLRTHPHAPLQDGTPISAFSHQENTWDDYCTAIERDTTWGDPIVLFAIVQHFGTRAVVISSCPGTRYVTEVKPSRFKHVGTMLLVQWAKFAWAGARPWSSAQLFKPEPKALSQTAKLGALAASPRGMEFKTDASFHEDLSASNDSIRDGEPSGRKSKHMISFEATAVDSKDPFVAALRDSIQGWAAVEKGDDKAGDAEALSSALQLSGVVLPAFSPETTGFLPPTAVVSGKRPLMIERAIHHVPVVQVYAETSSSEDDAYSPIHTDEDDLMAETARVLFGDPSLIDDGATSGVKTERGNSEVPVRPYEIPVHDARDLDSESSNDHSGRVVESIADRTQDIWQTVMRTISQDAAILKTVPDADVRDASAPNTEGAAVRTDAKVQRDAFLREIREEDGKIELQHVADVEKHDASFPDTTGASVRTDGREKRVALLSEISALLTDMNDDDDASTTSEPTSLITNPTAAGSNMGEVPRAAGMSQLGVNHHTVAKTPADDVDETDDFKRRTREREARRRQFEIEQEEEAERRAARREAQRKERERLFLVDDSKPDAETAQDILVAAANLADLANSDSDSEPTPDAPMQTSTKSLGSPDQFEVKRLERARLLLGGWEEDENMDETTRREVRRLSGRASYANLPQIVQNNRVLPRRRSLSSGPSSPSVHIQSREGLSLTPVNRETDGDSSLWDNIIHRLQIDVRSRDTVIECGSVSDQLGILEVSLAGTFSDWKFIQVDRGLVRDRPLAFAVMLPLEAGSTHGFLWKVNGRSRVDPSVPSSLNLAGELVNQVVIED